MREPLKFVRIEGPTNEKMTVTVENSYADNILVVGPRYINKDFKISTVNILTQESSGVLIFAINGGIRFGHILKEAKVSKFYKLKGILGQMRENNFSNGRILEKSTWKHIKREHIDRICASMQASHQKKMFELCGLDIQSQEAYELAVKGPIRPTTSEVPMIYSVKCIHFEPPEFSVEIVCINETQEYLKSLIAEIGYRLHSTAHCNYLQCSQYGAFNVKNTLLSKHWDLSSILDNIRFCQNMLSSHADLLYKHQNHLEKQSIQL